MIRSLGFLCFGLFLFSQSATAADDWFTIEPLYGFERVQKFYPLPARYRTRSFLGVRAILGPRLLSGEVEVTHASDTEEFPDQDLKVKETSKKGKLGVRSTLKAGNYLGFFLRAGMQVRDNDLEITENGVSRSEDPAPRWDPYAGTGVQVAIADVVALTGGVTAIFAEDIANHRDYEYQYSLGVTFRVGSLR